MAVAVYKAMKYRCLAGKKIYRNGSWITLPDTAKMYLNGAWRDLPFSGPMGPVIVPAQTLTHENGVEPATGTKWYITPDGRGTMAGTSWANAAPGSAVHAILLSCSAGDSVYFSSGDYAPDRTLVLPASVNLYGGFVPGNESWATRNGFAHQSIFTGTGTFGWMDGSAAVPGQIIDGFVICNYNSTITGDNAALRNSIVTLGTTSLRTAYNCVFVSTASTVYDAEKCNFFYGSSCNVSNSARYVNVVGTNSTPVYTKLSGAQYCTAVYCCISGEEIHGATSMFVAQAVYCSAINCQATAVVQDNNVYGNPHRRCSIFGGNSTHCLAVNCLAAAASDMPRYYDSENIDCSIFYSNSHDCAAVNCLASISLAYSSDNSRVSIFAGGEINCLAVNCSSQGNGLHGIFDYSGSIVLNCTAVNCSVNSNFYRTFNKSGGASSAIENCIAWNCERGDLLVSTTSASSTYSEGLTLTLGNDNSIARFTDTGYFPAQGVQDVGDCPDPISDPTGYVAYLAAFGDWHPSADSFLVGRGTADQNVTTDADGVARPDPPTIGAYEPRPTNGGE